MVKRTEVERRELSYGDFEGIVWSWWSCRTKRSWFFLMNATINRFKNGLKRFITILWYVASVTILYEYRFNIAYHFVYKQLLKSGAIDRCSLPGGEKKEKIFLVKQRIVMWWCEDTQVSRKRERIQKIQVRPFSTNKWKRKRHFFPCLLWAFLKISQTVNVRKTM